MSLILKGIDMPKDTHGETVLDDIRLIFSNANTRFSISLDKDDIIQIPTPHGRLIDGDKLCYEFIDWQYTEAPDHLNTKEGRMVTDHERQYEIYLALGEAVIEIAKAPTILEAEE